MADNHRVGMQSSQARGDVRTATEALDNSRSLMETVELFAGIGGFRIAADKHRLTTIWANDISTNACAVYRDRFGPADLHEGDIRELWQSVPSHDLLLGGFPCQPFSSAGKKHGIRDPRGTLFQTIVDILREQQPTFFILENVKRLLTMERGLHFATILSSLAELDYTIEWRLLNAMHFGLPQNRQRVFIVGVAGQQFDSDDFRMVSSTKLATAQDLSSLPLHDQEDLGTLETWKSIEEHGSRFPSWGVAANGYFFARDLTCFCEKSTLVPVRDILDIDVAKEFDFTESTLKWISANTPVNRLIQGVEIISNQGGGARMGYTIFGINGLAPTLTSTTSRHYERYKVGDRYRRLTNIEYARIQGFPDDHCSIVSVYDQYALFGNAVPPPMVEWVIRRLRMDIVRTSLPRSLRQKALF